MSNFIICRHCKSSMDGLDHERKLDDDGISQSNSLSKKISQKIDSSTIIYSSPFVRAMQSLEPLITEKPSIKIFADDALKEIKKRMNVPLIADIHFNYRMALEAVDAGAEKIRINPGNIGSKQRVSSSFRYFQDSRLHYKASHVCN